MEKLSTINY